MKGTFFPFPAMATSREISSVGSRSTNVYMYILDEGEDGSIIGWESLRRCLW